MGVIKVRVTERQDQKGSMEFTVDENEEALKFVRRALKALGSAKATFDIENMRTKKTSTALKGKTLKSLGVKDGDVIRVIGRKPTADEEVGNVVAKNVFEEVSSAPRPLNECKKELEAMQYPHLLDDVESLGEELGHGSFGSVWPGRIKKTGQEVAVKEIMSECTNLSKEERERKTKQYWREVLIMATLKHPALMNIVGYTPFTHTNKNRPALLMPLMARSVEDMIKLEQQGLAGDWDLSQKHIVIYGIACGMAFLHKNRIIHRDLKPMNVLLDKEYYPYVTDFGLSKFVREGQTMQQSVACGTMLYMAPEQFTSDEYGPKVDVYAFGLTMFAILSGNPPFVTGPWAGKHVMNVIAGMRPSLDTVPEQYHQLIKACWSGEPSDRPDFKRIVKELGQEKYLLDVDVDQFKDYQARIAPEALVSETSKKTALESIKRRAGQAPPPSSTYVLRASAEKGDIDAMYRMAARLKNGDGVDKDEAKAFEYFQKAFDGGLKQAAFDLGQCYKEGIGTKMDLTKAVEMFKIGVKNGDVQSMLQLGLCHFYGIGVPRNEIEACKLFKQASDEKYQFGDAESMYGTCLEEGKGCKADMQKALEMYRRACDHGSPQGMFNYADMFHHAKKVPQDIVEACNLYWLSAKAGFHDAFYALYEIYHDGMGPVAANKDLCKRAAYQGKEADNFRGIVAYCELVDQGWFTPKSSGEARELREYAESEKFSSDQNNFAVALDEEKGCRKDLKKAEQFYRLAGKNGNGTAWSNLGVSLMNQGRKTEARECFEKSTKLGCATGAICFAMILRAEGDHNTAFLLAKTMAERGHIDAYTLLGSLYMKGQGCQKDLTQGFSWYRKAADGDHPKGMYKTGCCYLAGKGTGKDVKKGRDLLTRVKNEAEDALAAKAIRKLGS